MCHTVGENWKKGSIFHAIQKWIALDNGANRWMNPAKISSGRINVLFQRIQYFTWSPCLDFGNAFVSDHRQGLDWNGTVMHMFNEPFGNKPYHSLAYIFILSRYWKIKRCSCYGLGDFKRTQHGLMTTYFVNIGSSSGLLTDSTKPPGLNHYQNHCWLIINMLLRPPPGDNFTEKVHDINH